MDDNPSILIVDDRPDKLLALKAVLEELCPSIVTAESGRQALRHLLQRDFALILLDVNMAGMDGFETASLIRQRKNSEATPIIFVTSYGDDMHVAQGYSLGAVDYILSPIVPAVLRTKVAVFLDLYRKTREVERQALHLRRRAEQLHKLTEASLEIHSAQSMDAILQIIADTARDVIGVHFAALVLNGGETSAKSKKITAVSAEFDGDDDAASGADIHALWRAMDYSRRLTRSELAAQPEWQASGQSLCGAREPRGWLAAELAGRDGREIGLIQLADKRDGDFTEDDEALLVQLSQMASIAIENILNSEAREANRIKDEFLATLSHELRTPLTAMLTWTQLLRTGSLDAKDAARGLEVIERNVSAQTKLIDDLLDVSRIITGKLRLSIRSVSLISVIEAALDMVRPAANAKRIRLNAELDPNASAVAGDPDRLQQVISNLLVNAIKFTPAGGEVRVRLFSQQGESRIELIDTGEGVHPEFLPYIFDRFRQADSTRRRSHGGLGIGLAIVRHLVELHGGSVSATSAGRHRGATFAIHLPRSAVAETPMVDAEQGCEAPPEPAAVDLRGICVLVVDDEPDGRDAVAKVLESRGAKVTTAACVREALELLRQSPPHVLVSDIGLPDEDGYDLIRKVRELEGQEARSIPALALTAFAREEDSQRSLAAGFQQHASKPIEPNRLAALVDRLARHEPTPVPPSAGLAPLLSDL